MVFSEQMLEHWDYPWYTKTSYCYTSSQETFTWW